MRHDVRWAWLTLWLVLPGLGSGCSFVAVRKLPPHALDAPRKVLPCSTSVAPPVLDGVAAVLAGVLTTALISAGVQAVKNGGNQNQVVAIVAPPAIGSAALGVVYVASGVYGLVATNECREAQRTLAETPDGTGPIPPPSGIAPPAGPSSCTDTPEFRYGSAAEKKRILDECRQRARETHP